MRRPYSTLFALTLLLFTLACREEKAPVVLPPAGGLLDHIHQTIQRGDYPKAQTLARQAYDQYSRDTDPALFATAGDQLGLTYYLLGKMDSAARYFQEAHDLRRDLLPDHHPDRATSLNHLGLILYVQPDHLGAVEKHREALLIFESQPEQMHLGIAESHTNLGKDYLAMGNFPEAKRQFEAALELLSTNGNKATPELANAYANLGRALVNLGDHSKASTNYQLALQTIQSGYGNRHPLNAHFYGLLAGLRQFQGAYEEAIAGFQKSLQLKADLLGKDHHELGYLHNGLGDVYQELKQYRTAAKFHRRALDIFRNAFGTYHPSVSYTYFNLGRAALSNGEHRQAEQYLNQARELADSVFNRDQPTVAGIYYYLGQLKTEQGHYRQALAYLREAAASTGLKGEDFEGVADLDCLANVLFAMGENYREWYIQSPDLEWKQKARRAFHLADRVVHHYRSQIPFIRLHKTVAQSKYKHYEQAIRNNLELFRLQPDSLLLEEVFHWMEGSHVFTLHESLRAAEAGAFAGIPTESIREEKRMMVDIHRLEREAYLADGDSNDAADASALRIEAKKHRLEEEHLTFLQDLEAKYPDYTKLKNDLQLASLSGIREEALEKGETLLEYFVGDTGIFIAIIGREVSILEVPKDFPLEDWVNTLYRSIAPPVSSITSDRLYQQNGEQYIEIAFQLFQKLVAPAAPFLSEKIVIIPDGVLSYLPFEILLRKKPERYDRFHDHAYFLREHHIRYSYSATILKSMQEKQHRNPPRETFLGVAPAFELNDGPDQDEKKCQNHSPLIYNQAEASELNRLMGGTALLGRQARKSRFKALAPNFRILHLATHARANHQLGELSSMAFNCEGSAEAATLYTSELYGLTLNADLVVLSACETGSGALQQGEGITGLTRGFAYAGAKSIVSSLWSIDDESTKELMIRFYTHLGQGYSKSAALASAKQSYLDEVTGKRAHPYYWSGFILVGDDRALF